MEYSWLIILVMAVGYFDIKTYLKKILNNQNKEKKDFSFLDALREKEIQIEIDDDDILSFESSQKGVLKDFNDVWLILEVKNKKSVELIYYRMSNIKGVVEVK